MAKKVVVNVPQVQLPVLPPVQEALSWLGLPTGPGEAIRAMAKEQCEKPPADNKTLKKMSTEGISQRKADELRAFAIGHAPCLEESAEAITECGFYTNSNGWQWQALVSGIRANTWLRPGYAIRFLDNRIAREHRLIHEVRNEMNTALPAMEGDRLVDAIADAVGEQEAIPRPIVLEGMQALGGFVRGNTSTPSRALFRWLHYARVDFYYRLLCEFSLDFISVAKKAPNFSQIRGRLVSRGLFMEMAPKEADRGQTRPIERLMDRWRILAGVDKPLSWRQLAQCMPVPKSKIDLEAMNQNPEDIDAEIFETQWRRLKEWRSGTRPSPEHLRTMVENILPTGYDVNLPVMQAAVAVAWGAFVEREFSTAHEHNAISTRELGALLASFGDYWERYKGQAAEIAA